MRIKAITADKMPTTNPAIARPLFLSPTDADRFMPFAEHAIPAMESPSEMTVNGSPKINIARNQNNAEDIESENPTIAILLLAEEIRADSCDGAGVGVAAVSVAVPQTEQNLASSLSSLPQFLQNIILDLLFYNITV